jgi:hypothetical protein
MIEKKRVASMVIIGTLLLALILTCNTGLISAVGNGDGLKGEYYDNMDLTGYKLTRVDPTLNLNWVLGSPDPSIGVDTFSIRWTGQIQPLYSENYTFYLTSDNGRRLWVNGQLVIDKWIDDWDVTYSGTIALSANQKYDIMVEYFENSGGAYINFEWSSPSQARQIVPQSQLYSNPGVGLFSDNFDDGNANGWTTYGGTWSVVSGQYSVNQDPGAKSVADGTSFSDFTYEADLSVSSTGNCGVIFRVTNPAVGPDSFSGYFAGIDCGNSRVAPS